MKIELGCIKTRVSFKKQQQPLPTPKKAKEKKENQKHWGNLKMAGS